MTLEYIHSGDHFIGKENIYVALPHLNGHSRVGFYNRTKQELYNNGCGIMDYSTLEEVEKYLQEDKLVWVKTVEVKNSSKWCDTVQEIKEKDLKEC